MRAVVCREFGPPEGLQIEDLDVTAGLNVSEEGQESPIS